MTTTEMSRHDVVAFLRAVEKAAAGDGAAKAMLAQMLALLTRADMRALLTEVAVQVGAAHAAGREGVSLDEFLDRLDGVS